MWEAMAYMICSFCISPLPSGRKRDRDSGKKERIGKEEREGTSAQYTLYETLFVKQLEAVQKINDKCILEIKKIYTSLEAQIIQ